MGLAAVGGWSDRTFLVWFGEFPVAVILQGRDFLGSVEFHLWSVVGVEHRWSVGVAVLHLFRVARHHEGVVDHQHRAWRLFGAAATAA